MNSGTGTSLSEAQRAAVLDDRPRVLVSAAAGSGKTRLLVACFIQALIQDGLPLEKVIAVTFTRKAGAELVSRIRSSLRECGRSDLALSLDRAAVGTIHSFCRRVLKDRALEGGIDPAFSVLEAESATLVKEELSGRVWEQTIEEADDAELGVFASRGDGLRKEFVALYDRLRGIGRIRPQVAIAPGSSEEEARSALARAVERALVAASEVPNRSATLEADLSSLKRCLEWLRTPREPAGLEADLRITEAFFPGKRTAAMEPHFVPVRTALTKYRECLAEVRLRPVVTAMNSLLGRFHDRYETYKAERSLLDFADLELRALSLLESADVRGAETALPHDSRLFIDEFQDTNELQYGILERAGASRLLMVGDERQSIYRFRGADVGVFRRREAELAHARGMAEAGALHRLDVNYRSRPELLAFINRLFAHESFFGSSFVPLLPRPSDDDEPAEGNGRAEASRRGLTAQSASPAVTQPVVEVLVVERMKRLAPEAPTPLMQEAEAQAVASCVRRLLDCEGWELRDIVVLTPAQTHVALYQRALMAAGIEIYVVGGKGYYAREEVSDVTALLQLLLSPHDDLVLVTVLRSPMVGLSDDGLYLLGREARKSKACSLWEVARKGKWAGLGETDATAAAQLVGKLTALRHRVGRPGLAQLIDDAVSEFGYDLCLLQSTEGNRRFANVRKLMRMADDFEALEGPDLGGFATVVRSMGDLSDREGSAPVLAEGENVVRVMTVHQAKGLEFPVVVLAGLGSDVPRAASKEFVVAGDGRVGVFLKGSRREPYESQDLCWGPASEVFADEKARGQDEDVRLLYVAMTRARERLVLLGAEPSGKVESCRIGRIVKGLGLDLLPPAGAEVLVDGLDAVVIGVKPEEAAADNRPGAGLAQGRDPGEGPPEICPRFVEDTAKRTRLRRISYSALAAHERCPRRFYLEWVLGLGPAMAAFVRDEPFGGAVAASTSGARPHPAHSPRQFTRQLPGGPDADSMAAALGDDLLDESEAEAGKAVGLLVHALLERFASGHTEPAFDRLCLEAQESARIGGLPLSRGDLERALRLTQAFWRSPVAARPGLVGAKREAPFYFAEGDLLVTGVMDLLWNEDGVWQIVDYKTNALGGRSIVEAASAYELQAAVYSLAALRAGAEAVLLELLFLDRPEEPVIHRFGREDLPRLQGLLGSAAAELDRGTFERRPGDACSHCSVAGVCAGMALP